MEENALISVSDTGYGIPIQQQKQIFQKFFRADNARVKEPDGNGLGLYIVKSIVEHEDGVIWFTSVEGKGSTFYVKFPLAGMKRSDGAVKPLDL
jgi:signal transduction histidine kinase